MNKIDDLDTYIAILWHQLSEASKNQDWPAIQQACRKMGTLQELDEQSRILQQRIAEACADAPPPPAPQEPVATSPRSMAIKLSSAPPPPALQEPVAPMTNSQSTRPEAPNPRELWIGTHHLRVSAKNQIPFVTANWILAQGKPLPRIPNLVHPSNIGFAPSAQIKRLDDGSFMELGDSQDTVFQKAKKLLSACGLGDLKFEVLFEDGSSKAA